MAATSFNCFLHEVNSMRKDLRQTDNRNNNYESWLGHPSFDNQNQILSLIKNFHKEEIREEKAFVDYKLCITDIEYRIKDMIASMKYEESNTESIGILEDQISRMNSCLNIYQQVKLRACRLYFYNEQELLKQTRREIYRLESRLPVFSQRINIEKHFNDTTRILIIQGLTGSGKSTQIPQYVADHPRFIGKRIICTQPRKIAAVSLAKRVAFEYNGGMIPSQGGDIGYHVGGQRQVQSNCRIEFVTEGVLLERIVNATRDIFENVGCIIIDEAHERSVTCDIILGYFKREDPRWKHIYFIVTSATIDMKLFSNYFNGAPCLEIEGRTFPVDLKYTPIKENDDIRYAVAICALRIHRTLEKETGDILCFLPGQEDVLHAKSIFETELSNCAESTKLLQSRALVLYGRMEPDQQSKVFDKLPKNERKIIFSTDVAETSVTIDGVFFVVDSGVKKEIIFDPIRNISSLKITTISKSSAIQRAGRCGRTQPGVCYRLYSEEEFEKMEINTMPEIHRKPISLAVLTLRGMKIDPANFDWISAPSKDSIIAADEELRYLGALDMENELTELGKLISCVQQEPKIVKMIYTGCKNGFGEATINIASVMSVSNIVFWNGNNEESKLKARKFRSNFSLPEGDIVSLYRIFEKWLDIWNKKDEQTEMEFNKNIFNERKKNASKWCVDNFVNGKAMNLAFATRRDLLNQFKYSVIWKKHSSQEENPTNANICRLACSGYFLNAARWILSKNSNVATQYHALHSEVTGRLDNKSALLSSSSKMKLPQWIIYDKIFRPSVTIFPVTSFIELSWIAEECPKFYHLCIKKEIYLPTEILTKRISQECLRLIAGKRFANIEYLKQEWKCEISGDLCTGRLQLICNSMNKPVLECLIDEKIAEAVSNLGKQVTEEDYLDGTRVVIGQGFEVKDVLFPQEYATLFIKNIPKSLSSARLTNLLTQGNEELGVLEIVEECQDWNANAKFCFKNDAKRSFHRISNLEIGNRKIKVQPKFGSRRNVSQSLSTRLKFSWAIEFSIGTANIDFNTAEDGNSCIQNISQIFPGAKITRVHGDSDTSVQRTNLNQNEQSKNLFPPVVRRNIPYSSSECRYQFNVDAISVMPHRDAFIYKITVVNLPVYLDEQDIKEILTQYRPKVVKVMRGKDKLENSAKDYRLDSKDREAKLNPLKKFWKSDTTTRDFIEVNVRRAGVYIFFNGNDGNSDAKKAYNKADFKSLGLQCGQRHRLDIDYTHSVSINQQLLSFLQTDFEQFKLHAQQKGIKIIEVGPKNHSRFTVLRFRTNRESNILWIQEELQKITTCIKFTNEKIGLLFTKVGRLQMSAIAETGFVHWNNKNYGIWIYGSAELKEEISESIKNVITSLSSMELIDHVIEMNKNKFDAGRYLEISELCKKLGVNFHHIFGCKLYLTGSKNSVKNLESYLHEKGLIRLIYNQNEETRECGVCFCVPDEAFIVTILCGHLFCIDCITPMFDMKPAPPLPITCPTCNVPLAINDILKCAPVKSLRSILEVSVYDYQSKHSKEVRICPKPDCSQILSYDSRTTGKIGGDFLFCNECVLTYCATCSEKLQKPIKSHEESSCEDVQSGISSLVSKLVREIQENILNLSCPKCNTAFYDFSGCAAVTCQKCNCGFCGLCLEFCGVDAHSHVLTCPKNTGREYFVPEFKLNEIHRSMRKQKLREFVEKIETPKIRNNVCLALRKDLHDLGIDEMFFKTLLVADISRNED